MGKRRINIDELKNDNLFKVPEGYFEELPSIIQSRVLEEKNPDPIWIFHPAAQWATVAASILAFVVYFSVFRTSDEMAVDAESLIAQVSMEDLVGYLENSDITTEELIASVNLEDFYLESSETEDLFLEDIDINDLESFDLLEAIDPSQELL